MYHDWFNDLWVCLGGGKDHLSFICIHRSLGALRAPTSSWSPFGPLDFVLRALLALRRVRRARLRSGPVKIGNFFQKLGIFGKWSKWSKMVKNGGPDLKRAQRTGLSARRARRTKSSRPEGPKAGPKGRYLEVGARRAPRLLVIYKSHQPPWQNK